MKYREFIQSRFLIDEPKTGRLVPFIFRPVQNRYYDALVQDYDLEKKGLQSCIRELLLKARREGFSSLILGLFAADDFLSENPTETTAISYRDDATYKFRKRYRNFILSCLALESGLKVGDIQNNPTILELFAKQYLSKDEEGDYELRHNRSHFYCGTASARVGGRGGVLHKLLFSEIAFYPDKEQLRAKEIVDGTMRQVDIASGWIFCETTGKPATYFHKMWEEARAGRLRFRPRFFSWKELYSPQEFELIKQEFVDKKMQKQEYPETEDEAFIASGDNFFDPEKIKRFITREGVQVGYWTYYAEYVPGHRYALGADVSEGIGLHNSTIVVWDFDAKMTIGELSVHRPEVVAVYCNNKIAPDLFAFEIRNGAMKYGNCLVAPERNNHGFTTLSKLKEIYHYIYQDEYEKLGWQTTSASKPKMLHDFNLAVNEESINIPDEGLKREMMLYPAQDLNETRIVEEEGFGHWDRIIAAAIGWQMRSKAMPSQIFFLQDDELKQPAEVSFDPSAMFNEL